MLKGFYCPDNEPIEVEDCLQKCRLGERCLTLPTLRLLSKEREQKILWVCPCCGKNIPYELDKEATQLAYKSGRNTGHYTHKPYRYETWRICASSSSLSEANKGVRE